MVINTISQTHLPEEKIWAEWKATQKETLLRTQTLVCLPFVHTNKSPSGACEEGHNKSHIENYQSSLFSCCNITFFLPTCLKPSWLTSGVGHFHCSDNGILLEKEQPQATGMRPGVPPTGLHCVFVLTRWQPMTGAGKEEWWVGNRNTGCKTSNSWWWRSFPEPCWHCRHGGWSVCPLPSSIRGC